MMALVRGDSTARTVSGVMFWLSGSTSAKTGRAPHMTTVLADAMKLRGVTTTSSPGPMPRTCRARSSATVPFARAIPKRDPQARANSCSNARPSGPVQ